MSDQPANTLPACDDWPQVTAWRREQRQRILARRVRFRGDERAQAEAALLEQLGLVLDRCAPRLIGFYWPFKGEIDLRDWLAARLAGGVQLALPVVLKRAAPLAFRRWQPGAEMVPGIWQIPVPADETPVEPELLISPLVGFDRAGYRLGYGGGYYDRTLASRVPRPTAIGIGFDAGRLDSILPQPFDVPMDAVVTESGINWRAEEAVELSSPPCSRDELDPNWL